MIDEASKEYLLEPNGQVKPSRRRSSRAFIVASFLGFVASVLLNIFFFYTSSRRPIHDVSPYTGLPSDVDYTYTFHTAYWAGADENKSRSDATWEALDIDPVAVALSSDYIRAHNLEASTPFPWDTDKSIYYIKVYHHLHCLKILRHIFDDLLAGRRSVVTPHHVYHCLDAIRQDAMCRLDDTPMPIAPRRGNVVGDGQALKCRSWEKLNEWILAPERNACYSQIEEYRFPTHPLERFGYCRPDSRYYPVMTGYFDLHGHKDPFEGLDKSEG